MTRTPKKWLRYGLIVGLAALAALLFGSRVYLALPARRRSLETHVDRADSDGSAAFLLHETTPPINKHGGKRLFAPDLRARGWTQVEFGPDKRISVLALALLASIAMACPGRRAQHKCSGTRCAVAGFAVLGLAVLFSNGPFFRLVPQLEASVDLLVVLVSSDDTKVMRAVRQSLPRSVVGCTLFNHQEGEYHLFRKDAVAWQLRGWYQRAAGCDAPMLPPTFFLRDSHSDCTRLFTRTLRRPQNETGGADPEPWWFEKDASAGSHGKGVKAFNGEELRARWRVGASAAAVAAACGPGGWLVRSGGPSHRARLHVQAGVPPLLLSGGRKFDIRVYILLADRKPLSAWLHAGYLRFADNRFDAAAGAATATAAAGADRTSLIANVDISTSAKRHKIENHYFNGLGGALKGLLDDAEAAPMLRRLGLTAEAAVTLVRRRVREACASAARAMAPRFGGDRGRWLLLGVDVLLDADLNAYVLELNLNPELTLDAVRTLPNRRLAHNLFSLLAEAHRKSRPLFAPSAAASPSSTKPAAPAGSGAAAAAPRADTAVGCTVEPEGRRFVAAPANSSRGRELLRTAVPGWQLLYSEAVEPAYCAAPPPQQECAAGAAPAARRRRR